MRPLTAVSMIWLLGCQGTITGPAGDDDDTPGVDGGIVVTPDTDAAPPEPDAAPPEQPLAGAIHVRDISVYQAIEIEILENGTIVPDADRGSHLVAGQKAMVGVWVTVDAEWQSRQVVAELTIEEAPGQTRTFTATETITGNTGTLPTSSGFTIAVDGDAITLGAGYSLAIKEVSANASYPGSTDGARFPATDGAFQDLEVRDPGPLNIVLVPFQYNADGSGRLPPLDATALGYYRDLFSSIYPTGTVTITVRDPVPYSSTIGATSGWNNWLDTLTSIRDNDNPPSNTYYYGVASPRSSFNSFCSNGCIVGLGWVPGANDEYGRASVGVSFPEYIGTYTAAHEIGHTLGRSHAPCGGPSGVDQGYPYGGASIGVWGYYGAHDELLDPGEYTDIMGYCNTQWISDYTHDAIFHRLVTVNGSSNATTGAPTRYRVGIVDGDGNVEWTRYDDVSSRVAGEIRAIAMADADGNDLGTVEGHYYRYDHLEGGMLLVPVASGPEPVTIHAEGIGQLAW